VSGWSEITGHRQKTWAVYGDGELGGLITFERLSPWLGTAYCLFQPDFQGKGIDRAKGQRLTFGSNSLTVFFVRAEQIDSMPSPSPKGTRPNKVGRVAGTYRSTLTFRAASSSARS
jgi:hypothetical protein